MARKAPAGVGHNSGEVLMGAAQDQLRSIVDRIENLIDNEINPAKEALKEVYAEAKGNGFTPAVIRKIVALRAKDKAKVAEENALLALYAHALGVEDLV